MLVASILKAKGDDVVVASPATPVAEAIETLTNKRIGVIVITGPNRSVAGILSERDIVHGLAGGQDDFMQRPISEYMTADVVCCAPNQSLEDLMREMTNRRIRHLPVVVDGQLAGIVSIGDIVKYRLEELRAERDALQDYIATG